MSYQPSRRLFAYLESVETLVSPARHLEADRPGVITGGFGETDPSLVHDGMIVPIQLARCWMSAKANAIAASVQHLIEPQLNDGEYDALVSFAYNEGLARLANSSILLNIRAGEFDRAADCFLKYDVGAGKILHGLDIRRAMERNWFLHG